MDYTGKVISKNPPQPTQASASGVWTLDEAAAAVRNNNWPIVGVPNPISKSLRFNRSDSAYLTRTPAVAGNRRTWTWSGWIKKSFTGSGTLELFMGSAGTGGATIFTGIRFIDDQFYIQDVNTASYNIWWVTSAVFRDPSSWYHIVVKYDTTQASSANAVSLWVNGVSQTLTFTFASGAYVQNREGYVNAVNGQYLGVATTDTGALNTNYFSGYVTEVNFVDGQALTQNSFGQLNPNTGVWEPIRYTGTYGTNGFYLNFKDSSSISALGYDYSGNANNWTPNNFSVTAGAGNDSLTDVPTSWTAYTVDNVDSGGVVRGNYCTLNPLKNTATLSNGNLNSVNAGTSGYYTSYATMSMDSGKYYWEIEVTDDGVNARFAAFGIADPSVALTASTTSAFTGTQAINSRGWAQAIRSSLSAYGTGLFNNSGTVNSTLRATTTGTRIFMVAYNADTGKCWMGYEGTWWTGDPSAGTSEYFTATAPMIPVVNPYNDGSNSTLIGFVNFGQRPFSYSPPTGFKSLCTTNLPTPVIGATSTTQADDYFNTVLYTGNNTTQTVTVGFQPDLTWVKRRDSGNSHNLADVIRGATNGLASNSTSAAYTITGFDSFISTGFQLAADTTSQVNANGGTYVSWNWKAGGTGVSNTSGSISSTVSANTDAGCSVVTYTGNGSTGTIGHGCKVNNVATAPSMIIVKVRSTTNDWGVGHASVGWSQAALLNLTNAFGASSYFNSTAPTSTLFSVGNNSVTNANGATYVAYCFAPVAGFSAFGSYTGNGSSDGPFVYVGFRPRYILFKNSSAVSGWNIFDTARDTYNAADKYLGAQTSAAESSGTAVVDILSNGFKVRNSWTDVNGSGNTIVYAVFAESPFKYALAR